MNIDDAIKRLNDGLGLVIGRINALENAVNRQRSFDGDGQWISVPPWSSLNPWSANPSEVGLSTVPRDCTVLKFAISTQVATTNDASNYWTIKLNTLISGAFTVMATISTGTTPDTINTWAYHVTTTISPSVLVASTARVFYITASKTGAPGVLYAGAAAIYFI